MSTVSRGAAAETAEEQVSVCTVDRSIIAEIVEDLVSANIVGGSAHAKTV